MGHNVGMIKPELQSMPQISDRITFLYLEHCKISREDSAILVKDAKGLLCIPSAAVSVLLLGPGTDVTHRAMELIGDSGVTTVWMGEHGVRYYAGGRALTHQSSMLIRQAEFVSNQRKHLNVVRKMYSMRFPGEDVSALTMQQLRGREGSRVRKAYKEASKKWNVPWTGRLYKPEDFDSGDLVNKSLSAGNACLYGLAQSVIFALGLSPGLGFVHVGHERSFVYDIADLYKAEITIPIAFKIAAEGPEDIAVATRHAVRDSMVENHILERMVKDIKYLLSDNDDTDILNSEKDEVTLWDNTRGVLPNGVSYGKWIDKKEDANDSSGTE